MNNFKIVFFGLVVTGFFTVNAMNKKCPDAPKKAPKIAAASQLLRLDAQTFERCQNAIETNNFRELGRVEEEIGDSLAYLTHASRAELARLLADKQRRDNGADSEQ